MSYENHALEALPLLEALAKADPADREVRERLAVSLVSKAATVSPEEAATVLRRARSILLDLKKGGKLSDLGEILADGIPPDGGLPTFSTGKDAQAAMKEGESAFARRDFDAARRSYRRALALDPRLYAAALFVGDTYFAQEQLAEARTWFSRAVLIDPDQATAYRYLGDAQMKGRNMISARVSYLDAVVAEPYTQRPWLSLARWAKENGVKAGHPRIAPEGLEDGPDAGKAAKDPGKADDGRSHWRRYAETRAAWAKGRFKKTFPLEAAYRHSLAEESDALRQVARAIAADVKAGKIKAPDSSFANLLKLDAEGLLDAYVLYARTDQGIAEDYAAYRSAHRDELRRYLSEYVAPIKDGGPPAPGSR